MNRLLLEKREGKEGREEKRGREEKKGRKGKKKGRSLYGNHLPARSAPLCKVKIPTNQLICLHRSWRAKFCLSLFKMASCANETMAMEIFVVEVTRPFSVFYYCEFDRMMMRMLSHYLSIT